MENNIQCKSKFKIPAGVTGEERMVFPNIKSNKVFVSFEVEDCKYSNVNVLNEDILDTIILNEFEVENPLSMNISEKKAKILELDESGTLNDFITPLLSEDTQYYKNLFTHLGCLTGFDFEVIEEGYQAISDYKISICGISNNILRDQMTEEAHAYVSLESKPTQCFIARNNLLDDSPYAVERENTLGHEFFHCLGLNHPKYKSIKENIEHRSILEDLSPIQKNCYKKSASLEKALKCTNFPSMPTGDDVCALIDLYGFSAEESSSCDVIIEDFVAQYPKIVELSGADSVQVDL